MKVGEYTLYRKNGYRGWAITITPINIRIDNFHGFPHIHYSLKGKHHPIQINNLNEAYKIVVKHIENNKKIDKKKLTEELL
ncbi:MAG: hypothetical protein FWH29_08340 [Methanobrevibacter sp.]|nr:hypothetical protein [Methanobrevibacter sp.]